VKPGDRGGELRTPRSGVLSQSRGRFALPIGVCLGIVACSSGALVLGRLDERDDARSSTADASAVVPDGATDAETCEPPPAARHYTFDGVGTDVPDVRGGPPGRVLGGAALDGSGVLRIDGVDDYVDLPNGILAGLGEVTVALWVRRLGGPAYTRLFDFGSSSLGEDPGADHYVGKTYLAATPSTGFVPSGLAVLMSQTGSVGETVAASDVDLDKEMHLVVVVVANETLSLFHDGRLLTRIPRAVPLSAIVDHNAWLGRSQYSADPHLEAEYADVRIWGSALPDCAVRVLQTQGPNPP
jgi:hypothetical protein